MKQMNKTLHWLNIQLKLSYGSDFYPALNDSNGKNPNHYHIMNGFLFFFVSPVALNASSLIH